MREVPSDTNVAGRRWRGMKESSQWFVEMPIGNKTVTENVAEKRTAVYIKSPPMQERL